MYLKNHIYLPETYLKAEKEALICYKPEKGSSFS